MPEQSSGPMVSSDLVPSWVRRSYHHHVSERYSTSVNTCTLKILRCLILSITPANFDTARSPPTPLTNRINPRINRQTAVIPETLERPERERRSIVVTDTSPDRRVISGGAVTEGLTCTGADAR
ncbi:hypothetical protein TNCV_2695881 [Trichonephila clavipes]|nr:hypothetical protein TNCV_2695881 [Trichonephila clavipes]